MRLFKPRSREGAWVSGMDRCRHRQAEPVVVDGVAVACVCIECTEPLRADYIDSQRERAERTARCDHDDLIDISSFGELPGSHTTCAACGATNPDRMVS